MKQIVYMDKKKFILTDREFAEAYKEWQMGHDYLCARLDCSLTKMYLYTAPLYDNLDWEHRILPNDESTVLAYNKDKKEIYYVKGWPYEKLLNSITGVETYSGCIPKKMEIEEPVDEKIKKILSKTMLIDDFIDMKYNK